MEDDEDLAADVPEVDDAEDTDALTGGAGGDGLSASLSLPTTSSLGSAYDAYAKHLSGQRKALTSREKLRAMLSGLAQPTYGGGMRAALGNMAGALADKVNTHETEQKGLDDTLAQLAFKRDIAVSEDESKTRLALLKLQAQAAKAGGIKLLKTDINPNTGVPFSKDWNRDVPVGYVATNQGIMKREQYLALKAGGGSTAGGAPAAGAASSDGLAGGDTLGGEPPVDESYGKPLGSKPVDRKTALQFGYLRGWLDPKGVFHGQEADRVGTPDEIQG
ncbi:MAG: hypothetical protein IT204_26160, partial [Fimbriimonadaceae bacterium]|nr:hypothetical protein [Fimbriimonadaceae bacterium]